MIHRLPAWYRRQLGRDTAHLLYLSGTAIRLGALASVAIALPFVWPKYPHPAGPVVLLVGLTAVTAWVLRGWRRHHTRTATGLLIDVPAGLLALLIGAWLAPGPNPGWAFFAYPYTVTIAVTVGMATHRVIHAALLGITLAAGYMFATIAFQHAAVLTTIAVVPSYLANTIIGWATARLQRRMDAELESTLRHEMTEAVERAGNRERLRHARALHDRILQTLETLAFSTLLDNPEHRATMRTHAVWLRRFIETNESHSTLATALEAAVETARRRGLAVELHSSILRSGPRFPSLTPGRQRALVSATQYLLTALAHENHAAVMRLGSTPTHVALTILITGGNQLPAEDELALVSALLTNASGALLVDPEPYFELTVPR